MQANLEVLARPASLSAEEWRIMADITREHARLVALLDGLQRLARGDAAQAVPRERLDLADVSTPPSRMPQPATSKPRHRALGTWMSGIRQGSVAH